MQRGKKEVQRYHRVYGCSKGYISLVIEILSKEEFIVGLSPPPAADIKIVSVSNLMCKYKKDFGE